MIRFINQNVSNIQPRGWVAQWLQRLGLDQMIGGSNPESSNFFFSFLFIISSHLGEFSSFQSKKELKNCSFNFIISMFLCMYLSYMIRNRSQKFWDIYQGYLLTFEQDEPSRVKQPFIITFQLQSSCVQLSVQDLTAVASAALLYSAMA